MTKEDIHVVMLTQSTQVLVQFFDALFMCLHAFFLEPFVELFLIISLAIHSTLTRSIIFDEVDIWILRV